MFEITPINFWVGLISSLIIIISCGIIYFKTRDLYKLTSYKGIKYFNNAFLFFGISIFSGLIVRIIVAFLKTNTLLYSSNFGPPFISFWILISVYAGLMAGSYLIYSLIWKKISNPEKFEWMTPLILSTIAVLLMFILKIFVLPVIILLFLVAVILAYKFRNSRSKKGISQLYLIYTLLFASWVTSVISHIFIMLSTAISVFLQFISVCLFLIILYKVIKDTKGK